MPSFLRRGVHGWLASLSMLLAAACTPAADEGNIECRSSALVGGTEHAEYLALASAQERAVLRLRIAGGSSEEASCTAVLVAPRMALTAAHCVDAADTTFELVAGTTARVVKLSAENVALHPNLDLALLTWSNEVAEVDVVHPISVDLVTESATGDRVQLAGYGLTESGNLEGLRFATESIVETQPESFLVSADGRSGACAGDSGGPALSRDADGSVRVIGILSSGASSCTATDRYTRLRVAGDWLGSLGVAPGPGEELANCEFVGTEGRCFASSVLTCPGGASAHIERCEPGTQCGFDVTTGAFRCLPAREDPCGGVGDLGRCEGDQRLRCEDGSVVRSPCGACGAECKLSVRDGRAICTR